MSGFPDELAANLDPYLSARFLQDRGFRPTWWRPECLLLPRLV